MVLRNQPQQQRSQDRLEQILTAAAEVFWELGYDNATTHDVAQRAGTAVGTVYRFFPDKLAIFHALEKRHLDQVSVIQATLTQPAFIQQPLKLIVQQIVQGFAEYFLEPGPCVIYTQYFVAPEMFRYFDESYDRKQIERLSVLLRSRNPSLPEAQSKLIGQVFLRAYQVLLLSALRGDPEQRPAIYQEIEALLFRYLEPHVGDNLNAQLLKQQAQEQAAVMQERYQLSDRQTTAMAHALEHQSLTIQAFEQLCPEVSRRSLQRDLQRLVAQGLLYSQGETNQLSYRPRTNDT